MYKLAKNVHKEKGLLYKKLSILRFFFFFFFFCAIPQKSVIFVVSLTKSISVWVYPTAFFFVVYPFDCLLLYGNGLQCEALGSGVCWVPKSLIVRTSHHRFMCTNRARGGVSFASLFPPYHHVPDESFFAVWIDENSSVSGRQERWFSLTVTSLD